MSDLFGPAQTRNLEALEEARGAQTLAANPAFHIGVTANAGSGKTRVLVDRVIRLLLAGSEPDRVLCVTYTKAAASEMQARLFRTLGDWCVADDDALTDALRELDPSAPTPGPDALARARALFARALEAPGGLKIQTLHAFCERVLRRFPVEAGVEPGFDILDEAEAKRLARAVHIALADAALEGETGLSEAYDTLAARLSDGAVDGVFTWAADNRRTLTGALAEGVGPLIAHAAARFNTEPDADPNAIRAQAWNGLPLDRLRAAIDPLRAGSKTDAAFAAVLESAFAAPDPAAAFDALSAFITVTDKEAETGLGRRKRFVTKKTAEAAPGVLALFGSAEEGYGPVTDAVWEAAERARAAEALALTRAALTLTSAYLDGYAREKARRGALDFDDLTTRTTALLASADAAAWVLYKLDDGVDHILVDEAQDTAPTQWTIIERLSAEFFAGAGARDALRTVFTVGDEKQSIYSFQGAEPARFLDARQRTASLAPDTYRGPDLRASFRSAPAILTAVDAVFHPTEIAETLTPKGDVPTHLAVRGDIEGCVELWPTEPRPDARTIEDHWLEPVDAASDDDAEQRLATRIAETVSDWLGTGEAVSERSAGGERALRPMRPGDVMILVRRRGALFEHLIRELKRQRVPVAGADRISLPAELAVEDVLGAARVALAPFDDVAVAEFLKSPFLHPAAHAHPPVDEDLVFTLLNGRGKGVSAVEALRADADPRLDEARALVERLIARRADPPYAVLAGILAAPSATGETYMARLIARLGAEAEDPVTELLDRAIASDGAGASALERFVHDALADGGDIKREPSADRDEVRVMTVHGAKGLEAPVVFLPDAADGPKSASGSARPVVDPDAGLLWAASAKGAPAAFTSALAHERAAQHAEDLRLLYVAMTRAEDRLIVCGAQPGRRSAGTPWRDLVEDGLTRAGALPHVRPDGMSVVRLGRPPPRLGRAGEPISAASEPSEPAWLRRAPPDAAEPVRVIAPSAQYESADGRAEPVVLSPRGAGAPTRFARGDLAHKLFETLADLPSTARPAAGERLIARRQTLPLEEAEALLADCLAIMDDPAFAPVFTPGARAEAAIIGAGEALPDGVAINGRIDRLIVGAEVLAVDFKTNRPAPRTPEAASARDVRQMAAYRAVLRSIYPDRPVRCAILWTDGPALMTLPNSLLDAALADA